MIRNRSIIFLPVVGIAAFAGCAMVNPRLDYERVGRHVAETTGQENLYQPGNNERVAERRDELLRDGITADEAVQVCLLNNPTLQAAFMDIGMARADVVQSGLFSNPSLGVALQFPSGGGLANLEAGLAQNIADVWQIPVRKRMAERSLDQAILGLARQAADLAADTKVGYYEAVGADESLRISQENLVIAQNLLELALMRQQAGAANELDVNLSRSLALDAELGVEEARLAAADARRRLATLLGVRTDADNLTLLDSLPEVSSKPPDAQRLFEIARVWRLDIRSAQQAVYAAEARLRVEYRRVFPTLELGVALERGERGRSEGGPDLLADTARASIANGGLTAPEIQPRSEREKNTDFIIGPSLNLELPIFDQNQAQIAKARYLYEQASKTLEALDRVVAQEVRSAVDRTTTAWKLVRMYQERAIPLAQSNLDLSREAYRAGRASFLSVLEAQRFFLETRNGYVGAAQAAATAIPELERTIGLPFPKLVGAVDADATSDTGLEEETEP
jgi:cobalt-zinc-cadmium efflux system outer membrane protein